MARVFIGIPTLNRPEWVKVAVNSVLAQTLTDFRVIVSDNCSEPGIAESVSDWVRELGDPRVRFHQQPENHGEYGQGRYFLSEAEEEFFVILHDDDVLNADYLEQAVEALSRRPKMAFFVANPYTLDEDGNRWPEKTREYLDEHGRDRIAEGEIDVLTTLLESGFAPISGTCFRTSALRASGLVDDDCSGNFPFEMNVFLRLGEQGARAWFHPREMLGFRFHRESLRVYLKLMDNPRVVGTMTTLLDRRRFSGRNERRRRRILGRLHRATAMQSLREGNGRSARRYAFRAIRENPLSVKCWGFLPLALLGPNLLRPALAPPAEMRVAPRRATPQRADKGDNRVS